MPFAEREARLSYQRAYYRRHRTTLRKRSRLRQRIARKTPTLWHILPEPQGFCSAMAQKALNERGGELPPALSKEDLQQDIAEALVQGRAPSQCRNPQQYAASLAIKVALRRLTKEKKYAISKENQGTPGKF